MLISSSADVGGSVVHSITVELFSTFVLNVRNIASSRVSISGGRLSKRANNLSPDFLISSFVESQL